MRTSTTKLLNRLRCENLRYYTIEEGRGSKPDVVTVAYFAGNMYDISIAFTFYESYAEAKIFGAENIPLYKRDALLSGINDLYTGYRWLEFVVERNNICAKVDTSFDEDESAEVCYKIIEKISSVIGKSSSKYIW